MVVPFDNTTHYLTDCAHEKMRATWCSVYNRNPVSHKHVLRAPPGLRRGRHCRRGITRSVATHAAGYDFRFRHAPQHVSIGFMADVRTFTGYEPKDLAEN